MSRGVSIFFVSVVAVSAAVICLFLGIQYIWGEPFVDRYEYLTIRGRALVAASTETGSGSSRSAGRLAESAQGGGVAGIDGSTRVLHTRIGFGGFSLNFRKALTLHFSDGSVIDLAAQSYRKEDGRLLFYFGRPGSPFSAELQFFVLPEQPENIVISARAIEIGADDPVGTTALTRAASPIPAVRGEDSAAVHVTNFEIHYQCRRTIDCTADAAQLDIRTRERYYMLAAPANGGIDAQSIRIPTAPVHSIHLIAAARVVPAGGSTVPDRSGAAQERASPGSEQSIPSSLIENVFHSVDTGILYDNAAQASGLRRSFYENVYADVQDRAYLPAYGKWIDRDGMQYFSQETLLTNLALSIENRQYSRVYNSMRRAAALHSEEIDFLTVPYLGNTLTHLPGLRQRHQQFLQGALSELGYDTLATNVSAASSASAVETPASPPALTLLDNPDFLNYTVKQGGYELHQQLVRYLMRVDYFHLTLRQIITLLDVAADLQDPRLDHLSAAIDSRLLSAIEHIDDHFYLKSTSLTLDLLLNVRAVSVLRRYAQRQQRPQLALIADAIETGVLSLADNAGYIPATLQVRNNSIRAFNGYLHPSSIYSRLSPDHGYPRVYRLAAEQIEEQWWLLAHLRPQSYQIDGSSTAAPRRLSVTLPPAGNGIFHVAIGGVPYPPAVTINGADIANNRDFETYLQGRYWSSRDNLLIIRYLGNSSPTDIVINY